MVETLDASTQKEKPAEENMEELYETSMRNLQEGNIIKGHGDRHKRRFGDYRRRAQV